jgi:hypothetical protein
VLVAKLAQATQESLWRLVYASFALDGLDEYCGRLGTNKRLRGFEVAEGGVDEAGQHRTEAALQRGLGRRAQAAVGAAVEGLGERQDLVFVWTLGVVGVLA